jgi:hypothetical protein
MWSRYKYPVEYELEPMEIERGASWLTLKLKNTGMHPLKKHRICFSNVSDLHPDFHSSLSIGSILPIYVFSI